MNINKKVLGLALSLLVATNISAASATTPSDSEAEEVLFKIHDIKPVKNHDGEVIACDFNTTIYNRSPYTIKEALLNFEWKDKAIEAVIDGEKKAASDEDESNFNRAYSETERKTSKNINVMVEVPSINSYRQVTVNSRINTDRCFLLIEKVNFSVKSCRAEGAATSDKGRRGSSARGSCERMFKFVSPEDPQYYLEFKEISVDEEMSAEQEKKEKAKSEADAVYTDTVNALNSAGTAISSIK